MLRYEERQLDFYPRPPRGGRPLRVAGIPQAIGISIHALREEGDVSFTAYHFRIIDFYPRPPRGGRLMMLSMTETDYEFLSTPSARRATVRY